MPLRQHANSSNTLYLSNMDVWGEIELYINLTSNSMQPWRWSRRGSKGQESRREQGVIRIGERVRKVWWLQHTKSWYHHSVTFTWTYFIPSTSTTLSELAPKTMKSGSPGHEPGGIHLFSQKDCGNNDCAKSSCEKMKIKNSVSN